MEQTPNRQNIVDPRGIVTEKRIVQEQRTKRPVDELAVSDQPQIFGIDRNLIITLAIVGLSMGLSVYLFREVKKIRDDVRTLKSQEPDTELIEEVEKNSESIKAIETKLDQLITAIGSRERRFVQSQPPQQYQQHQQQQQYQPPQQMQSPQPPQPPQQPQQIMQPPPVNEQEYQNQQMIQQMQQQQMQQQQQQQMQQQQQHIQQVEQMNQQQISQQIPIMGGRIAGSAITIDDPGIIKI